MKKIISLLLAAFFGVTGFAQKTIHDANA